MLKTFVKINKVNNLSDARYCAGMGVNDLGFNIEPGTMHYLSPDDYKEVVEWVAGIRPVAELTTTSGEVAKQLLAKYSVGAIQVSTMEQLEICKGLGLPVIFNSNAVDINPLLKQIDLEAQALIEYLLISVDSIDEIASLATVASTYKVVIEGNFSAAEFEDLLINHPYLHGIALTGGEEIRAGYKDFDELAEVLEALEQEEEY